MTPEIIAGIIGIISAIIMVIKNYVEKKEPPKPETRNEREDRINEAIAEGDENTVSTSIHDSDRRMRRLLERWKLYKDKSGRYRKR